MMFLEKMKRFFSIFPVISASKSIKMTKIELRDKYGDWLDYPLKIPYYV